MEKRLFLAIGLSLIVVWLWSAPAARQKAQQISTEENVEKTQLIAEEAKAVDPLLSPLVPTQPSQSNVEITEEKLEIIDSEKLTAEFSNVGASLKKVNIKEFGASLPIENIAGVTGYEELAFTLDNIYDEEISYSYVGDGFKIVKSFKIHDGDYIIESGVEIYNLTDMSKLIRVDGSGYLVEMSNLNNGEGKDKHNFQRDKSLLEYAVSSEKEIHRKAGASKFAAKETRKETDKVNWVGFRDRYFCALVKPLFDTDGYEINFVDENRLKVNVNAKEVTLQPRSSARFDSIIYVGPEKINELKAYGEGFEKIKKYYRFGLFDGVAKIIYGMMHWIHKYVPNWGAVIIIISIVIYFSMYPLTLKGMLSMKRMQSLQPMIAKLKEKHKDNPQKMNKEMMELYKEHKVNPLGGCLPMLLQMPVFIGLYQVLWRSVSFKGAHFLWIKDLSEPDRLFTMPFSLPFLGNEFNLLPVIMTFVMYGQQKLSSKNMVITDSAQATQQKMMTTIMPIFIGAIFYKFASGLTLYFTMFYLFSTFTQWKMSKEKKGA